jgi:glutamine amidotransferase
MCRFVAFMGKNPILLNELLEKPNNSLIHQSRDAREGTLGLNGDGFGMAWYDHEIEAEPGIFKSIQPAWNDNNLKHLASKIKSNCFLGHVRASTIGDVVLNNCHPFSYKQYAFVHNGTIRGFEKIRKNMICSLSDDLFGEVKAQTDSEHLFFLIMQQLKDNSQISLEQAVIQTFQIINEYQCNDDETHFSRLNIAITDGKQLFVSRFVTKNQEALSLYYALGHAIDESDDEQLMIEGKKNGAVIVASEPLTDYAKEWQEVPVNHFLVVNQDLKIKLQSF